VGGRNKEVTRNLQYTIDDIKSILSDDRKNLSLHYFSQRNGELSSVTIFKKNKNNITIAQQLNHFSMMWQKLITAKDKITKKIIVDHIDDKVYREYETTQVIDKNHNYKHVRRKEVYDKQNNCEYEDLINHFEYNDDGTKIYH